MQKLQLPNYNYCFVPIFSIYCLFPAEVWSTPWWASNRQETSRDKKNDPEEQKET